MVRAEPLKSLTIPIHAERASRENRDDNKRYRAKTPRTHLTGKSLSRKGAKAAKYKQNCKFETRNPKFETISNGQKSETSKQARFRFCNWDLSLWVCFGFRYSSFGFCFGGFWRDKHF